MQHTHREPMFSNTYGNRCFMRSDRREPTFRAKHRSETYVFEHPLGTIVFAWQEKDNRLQLLNNLRKSLENNVLAGGKKHIRANQRETRHVKKDNPLRLLEKTIGNHGKTNVLAGGKKNIRGIQRETRRCQKT